MGEVLTRPGTYFQLTLLYATFDDFEKNIKYNYRKTIQSGAWFIQVIVMR